VIDTTTFKQLQELAGTLSNKSNSRPDQEFHYGIVLEETGNGTCVIQVNGLTDYIYGVRKIRTHTYLGAVVLVLRMGSDWLIMGTLDDGEQWYPFDPVWVNVNLGAGYISHGHYRRVGNCLDYKAYFQLGVGGSVTGTMSMEGPFNLEFFEQIGGFVFANDFSASQRYAGTANVNPGFTRFLHRIALAGTSTGWDSNTPFVWDDSDQLWAQGQLIIAPIPGDRVFTIPPDPDSF
jgi:hypothetical protein